MKIRVAIIEKDKSYLERIIKVFNEKFYDKIDIYYFTGDKISTSELKKYKINVLLIGEGYQIDADKLSLNCGVAYLIRSKNTDLSKKYKTILKYQKVEKLYQDILDLHNDTCKRYNKNNYQKKYSIISFLSSNGGTGCSTMAAACAVYMAKHYKKVLYLNLEKIGSTNVFFSGEGHYDFGNIIKSINRDNLAVEIQKSVKIDSTGVYFYDSVSSLIDIENLLKEDLLYILEKIMEMQIYEYIVLDFKFDLSDKTINILERSNKSIFVLEPTEICNYKFEKIYKELKKINENLKFPWIDNIMILYNKIMETSENHINDDVLILAGAPVFKNGTCRQIMKQLSYMGIFDKLLNINL